MAFLLGGGGVASGAIVQGAQITGSSRIVSGSGMQVARSSRILCAVHQVASRTEYEAAIAASADHKLTVMAFGMSWCKPCISTADDFVSLSYEFPGSFFYKV